MLAKPAAATVVARGACKRTRAASGVGRLQCADASAWHGFLSRAQTEPIALGDSYGPRRHDPQPSIADEVSGAPTVP
jgi:hypothetical protein